VSAAFELLFEAEVDESGSTFSLPEPLRAAYGGDWLVPQATGAPYVYVNFVTSRDGRVSFNEPGYLGGVHVAAGDRADRWLMGLLRARADAVLVGEGTVRAEPSHVWTAEHIWPEDTEPFSALRAVEGRRNRPLQIVLSLDGLVPGEAAMLAEEGLDVVVATTSRGAAQVPASASDVLALGTGPIGFERLLDALVDRYSIGTLLCEGGPRVYGSLLGAGVGHDEFLTLSPLVIGESEDGPRRPSLVESASFAPEGAPRARLLSVRRSGDYLYLRSRYPGA
jgi:riboflavin biosynthesis pyrimidine reductase